MSISTLWANTRSIYLANIKSTTPRLCFCVYIQASGRMCSLSSGCPLVDFSVVLVFVRLWFIKMYIRSVLRLWWKNISVILIPRLKTSRCNWYRPIFILRIYTMINCWYKDLRPHSVRSWCPVTQTKHSTALCWCETFLRSPSLSPPWRPQVFRGSGGLLQGG